MHFNLNKLNAVKSAFCTSCYILFIFFQMIKSQQLFLRNDAFRKLLGLPDTRAHVGYRAEKSPLEVPEMMQACPSTLCALVIFIMCN
jgi:hypothetical protein